MERKLSGAERLINNSKLEKKAVGLIHRAYLAQLKTSRKYIASTKTKSEVRGGGKKPWKQKGTGQARAGSSRSPLWVGGGVIFGPKNRSVYKKVNKKERRLAILSALYLKRNHLILADENLFKETSAGAKTKSILATFIRLGINLNSPILFVLAQPNNFFWLAVRNIKNVEVTVANCLNLNQILKSNQIILSNISIELICLTYEN